MIIQLRSNAASARVRSVSAFVCALFAMLSAHSWALQAIPITGKITLDGKLDDADWQRASVTGEFTENMPREKERARDKIEVRVVFDHEALYLGVRGYASEPSKIYAPYVRRDKVFGNQDNFII